MESVCSAVERLRKELDVNGPPNGDCQFESDIRLVVTEITRLQDTLRELLARVDERCGGKAEGTTDLAEVIRDTLTKHFSNTKAETSDQ